ncbi:MAG: CDP-glucose 4,6-dehydratase [Chitinivibrionales bacterium]|nr:CDP-glucose 4,6-dehydratase [Chitinivibrionales bacterium]
MNNFWNNKRVFVTGHTGFKGSWLCLWLTRLGALVSGYALHPPTNPNLFDLINLKSLINSTIGDIRDLQKLKKIISDFQPEIVFHLAAQPLVRVSYTCPVETYETNIMGTVNILESIKFCQSVRSVVLVTSDKCYENKEWHWGYREIEQMGGYDPYSSSKGCAELVINAYRSSFFNPANFKTHRTSLASVRAGNVVGGGDWAQDRLIPDSMKALLEEKPIIIRNPAAIRPWQHVLEPLFGYLSVAQKLFEEGPEFGQPWNFGPNDDDCKPVIDIVEYICKQWGDNAHFTVSDNYGPHEAHYLKLDCSKSKNLLHWKPHLNLHASLDIIISWYKNFRKNADMHTISSNQILEYERLLS